MIHLKPISSYNHNYYLLDASLHGFNAVYEHFDEDANGSIITLGNYENDKFYPSRLEAFFHPFECEEINEVFLSKLDYQQS